MQEPQEMRVRHPGPDDPLEEEMATHSGILAWRIPWTEEPDGLQSVGLQRVGLDRNDLAYNEYSKLSVCLRICFVGSPTNDSVYYDPLN